MLFINGSVQIINMTCIPTGLAISHIMQIGRAVSHAPQILKDSPTLQKAAEELAKLFKSEPSQSLLCNFR
jgi:hypothetical protein